MTTARLRALTGLGLLYLGFAYLAARQRWSFLVCPFRMMTGWDCPLCGLTHSVGAALQGDLGKAMHDHPLGPVVVLVTAAGMIGSVVRLGCSRSSDAGRIWH